MSLNSKLRAGPDPSRAGPDPSCEASAVEFYGVGVGGLASTFGPSPSVWVEGSASAFASPRGTLDVSIGS